MLPLGQSEYPSLLMLTADTPTGFSSLGSLAPFFCLRPPRRLDLPLIILCVRPCRFVNNGWVCGKKLKK
jgi:hypothetical protein